MKKPLTFIKVYETHNQRFYEASRPIEKVCNKTFNIESEIEYVKTRVKEKYKEFLPKEIKYICISDAHTHVERLVFIAMPTNEEKSTFSIASTLQIDGKHTMMIHGGSEKSVYPDEVYLRRLSIINK